MKAGAGEVERGALDELVLVTFQAQFDGIAPRPQRADAHQAVRTGLGEQHTAFPAPQGQVAQVHRTGFPELDHRAAGVGDDRAAGGFVGAALDDQAVGRAEGRHGDHQRGAAGIDAGVEVDGVAMFHLVPAQQILQRGQRRFRAQAGVGAPAGGRAVDVAVGDGVVDVVRGRFILDGEENLSLAAGAVGGADAPDPLHGALEVGGLPNEPGPAHVGKDTRGDIGPGTPPVPGELHIHLGVVGDAVEGPVQPGFPADRAAVRHGQRHQGSLVGTFTRLRRVAVKAHVDAASVVRRFVGEAERRISEVDQAGRDRVVCDILPEPGIKATVLAPEVEIQRRCIGKRGIVAEAVHIVRARGTGLPVDQETIRLPSLPARQIGVVLRTDVVVVRGQPGGGTAPVVHKTLAAGGQQHAVFHFHVAALQQDVGSGIVPHQAVVDLDHRAGVGMQSGVQALLQNGGGDIHPGGGPDIQGVGQAIGHPHPVQRDGPAAFRHNADPGVGDRQGSEQDAFGLGQLDQIRADRPAGAFQHAGSVRNQGVAGHPHRVVARSRVLHADRYRQGLFVQAGVHPDAVAGFEIVAVEGGGQGIQRRVGRGHPVVCRPGGGGIDRPVGVGGAQVEIQRLVADGKENRRLRRHVGPLDAGHTPDGRRGVRQAGQSPIGKSVRHRHAGSHRHAPGPAAIHGDLDVGGFVGEPASDRPAQGHGAVYHGTCIAKRDGPNPRGLQGDAGLGRAAEVTDVDPATMGHRLQPHGRGGIARVQQWRGNGI